MSQQGFQLRSFGIGAAAVLAAAVLVLGGYLIGRAEDDDSTNNPAGLGPQAGVPSARGEPLLFPVQTLELRLAAFEEIGIPFETFNAGDGCSNASCSILFTWNVRSPHPPPETLVEIFNEKMGAHQLVASGNYGEAGRGYFEPMRMVNRGAYQILVEVRYILVGRKILAPAR